VQCRVEVLRAGQANDRTDAATNHLAIAKLKVVDYVVGVRLPSCVQFCVHARALGATPTSSSGVYVEELVAAVNSQSMQQLTIHATRTSIAACLSLLQLDTY
jgi:hypothetical protein